MDGSRVQSRAAAGERGRRRGSVRDRRQLRGASRLERQIVFSAAIMYSVARRVLFQDEIARHMGGRLHHNKTQHLE